MKQFPCIECGLCCCMSGQVKELASLLNEEKVCKYYDPKTKHCRIYERRPLICNVGAMYDAYFKNVMSEKEYLLANLESCYRLNQKFGDEKNVKKIGELIQRIKDND